MLKAIRRRVHLSQREDGFSLVELVVAMVIIAGVLMALIGVQLSAASTIVESRKRTQATAFANEAMEQLRSIPWHYLSEGVYSGFETIGGDDPWVASGTLSVDGANYTLRTIIPGQENFTPARLPLFDGQGRNVETRQDPAATNAVFTVRAYVVEPWTGPPDSTLGLVVVVSWLNAKGQTVKTKVESLAYRGEGCGSELDTPYLGACQEYFDANSQAGTVATTVTATTVPAPGFPSTPVNLLYPTSDPFYSLNMRSVVAAASVTSQQVTTLTSSAFFGGTTVDDNDDATEPEEEGWVLGYATHKAQATDDVSSPGAAANVGPSSWSESEGVARVPAFGGSMVFTARSDYARPATSHASTNTQCISGINAGQGCASTNFANYAAIEGGSGYALMQLDSQIIRLSRRLADVPTLSNSDTAWVGRFSAASGSATRGCTAVSSSGCVSAGATRTLADLSIGKIVGGSWTGGQATDGIVVIQGSGSCSLATDSVMVQRGPSQLTAAAVITRCGQIKYWSGGAYSTAGYSASAAGPYVTAPVTWSNANFTVTAVARIEIAASTQTATSPDALCKTSACAITADSGSISVSVEYTITSASGSYIVVSTTVVDGASATASFKAAPDA